MHGINTTIHERQAGIFLIVLTERGLVDLPRTDSHTIGITVLRVSVERCQ